MFGAPKKLVDYKIKEFSDEVASASPAPGGGSVAALSGNLSAALISMVSNLTIGKPRYLEAEPDMRKLLIESEEIRGQLILLVDEDTVAFNKVMKAFKLPKGSEERTIALQEAFTEAADVPMKTAKLCRRAMDMSLVAFEKGNQNSITDAVVAAHMAYAGLHGALLNVRINLSSITDEQYVASTKVEIVDMAASADDLIEKLMNDAITKIES